MGPPILKPLLAGVAVSLLVTAANPSHAQDDSEYQAYLNHLNQMKDTRGVLRDFHVVAIGVNKYCSRSVPDLRGCVNDARALAKLFAEGLPLFQGKTKRPAHLLLDDGATKRGIVAELNGLRDWVADCGTVVIALSGHGSRWGDGWYFIPHDFDPGSPEATGLSAAEILDPVDRLVRAKDCRVILIIDACQAGQIQQMPRSTSSITRTRARVA